MFFAHRVIWGVVNHSTRLGLLTDHQNIMPQSRRWNIALVSYNVIETCFGFQMFFLFIVLIVKLRPESLEVYIHSGREDK